MRAIILPLTALSLAALSLTLAAPAAHADCKGDIAQLKARLASSDAKKPNVGAAKKEMLKAEEVQKDEVACDNAVSRAWRAYRAPPPPPAPGNKK